MLEPKIVKNPRVMYATTDYDKIELVVACDIDGKREMIKVPMKLTKRGDVSERDSNL